MQAVPFTSRAEVEAYVHDALDAHAIAPHTVDVAGVVDDLHQIAGGTWDVQSLSPNIFWAAVTPHHTTTS